MCQECREEEEFLEEDPMFPGLEKIGDLAKMGEEAKKKNEEQHKELVKLQTEIRELLREIAKALKGE